MQLLHTRPHFRVDRATPAHPPSGSNAPRSRNAFEERCVLAVQSRAPVVAQALPPASSGQEGPEGGVEQTSEEELQRFSELFLPADASADDWRTFRALLISNELRLLAATADLMHSSYAHSSKPRQPDQWAHLLAGPELGCLLVARHTDSTSDCEQGVVLLCNHEAEEGTGTSYGFYLNKPWRRRRATGLSLREGLADAFKDRTVYQGGMVSNRLIHVVHTCSLVQGSREILPGVYVGGLPHANALVKANQVALHRFKLVAGYMGWDAGQLRREVDEGKWWVVAASAPLVISFIQGTCPEETVGGEQESMWHEVLNIAGVPVNERPCPRLPPFM